MLLLLVVVTRPIKGRTKADFDLAALPPVPLIGTMMPLLNPVAVKVAALRQPMPRRAMNPVVVEVAALRQPMPRRAMNPVEVAVPCQPTPRRAMPAVVAVQRQQMLVRVRAKTQLVKLCFKNRRFHQRLLVPSKGAAWVLTCCLATNATTSVVVFSTICVPKSTICVTTTMN
jgi:hypothetical protein